MLVPEVSDELIRVDGFNAELAEDRLREIAQVERDDEPRAAVNRSRQNMAVFGVREGQRWDESFVIGDQAIRDVQIHEVPTTRQALRRDVRPIGQDVSGPLVVDFIRPTGLEQVREGKPHEQVSKRGRIQDASIVEDDWGHGSVAHIQLLAQRLKLVQRRVTLGQEIPLVGEEVFQKHTPMTPDLPTRHRPFIEELHQMRPRDV